jgi:uncharacterized membrane protein
MSNFAILKHPLHPMMVSLPIGLFIAAFVCDIVYLATDRDTTWYDAATWASGAGVVTALAAALPGLGDYLTLRMSEAAHRVATAHLIANLTLVAIFATAFGLMLNDGATSGSGLTAAIALHVVGLGVLVVSGWLGGELIYVHRVATGGPAPAQAHEDLPEAPQPGLRTGHQPR